MSIRSSSLISYAIALSFHDARVRSDNDAMARVVSTRPGLVLALLVAASAGLRFWAATRIPSPWITPDEQTYAELGRSLWRSGRFEILGQSTQPLSLVHPALVGAPLAGLAGVTGYTVAKAVQA